MQRRHMSCSEGANSPENYSKSTLEIADYCLQNQIQHLPTRYPLYQQLHGCKWILLHSYSWEPRFSAWFHFPSWRHPSLSSFLSSPRPPPTPPFLRLRHGLVSQPTWPFLPRFPLHIKWEFQAPRQTGTVLSINQDSVRKTAATAHFPDL